MAIIRLIDLRLRSYRIRFDRLRTCALLRHRDITSGLFVRARLPSNCLHAALRGENTWAAPFPLRINLWPRKRGGDCLCSRPPWFGSDVFTICAHCLPSRNECCQFSSAPESTLGGEDNLCLSSPSFFSRKTRPIAPSAAFTVKLHR